MREFLFPARWLYEGVTGFRNWLFDRSLIKASHVDAKVISVGNLTLGGTGKTPVTLALLELLQKRGFSCGVVSRGYKREEKGVLEVTVGPRAAATYGDEPALIKTTFPDVPVMVGNRRVLAAEALLAAKKVDFIVCDDAFQHRRLHRDLNILLLDATEAQRKYRVVPVGRARERMVPALRRADLLILTKTNLMTTDDLAGFVTWVKSRSDKPVIEAAYEVRTLRALDGQTADKLKDAVYMVSGIAKPEAFEKTLGDRVRVVKHRTFGDHHKYSNLEVEEILDEASKLQARWVLTTAKDSMKLSAFPRLRDRLWVVELGLQFKGEVDKLYEAVDRLARKGP